MMNKTGIVSLIFLLITAIASMMSCNTPDDLRGPGLPSIPTAPASGITTIPVIGGTAVYTGEAELPPGVDADRFWQNSPPVTPITSAYDGQTVTPADPDMYHSPWNPYVAYFYPVELTFSLDASKAHSMDGITLYPRTFGSNGIINDVDVLVWCEGSTGWEQVAQRRSAGGVIDIAFEPAVVNPRMVKLVVTKGNAGFVSLGEIVCYTNSAGNYDCFTDLTCSAVKGNLALSDLENIADPYLRHLAKRLWYAQNDREPEAGVKPYDPVGEGRLMEVRAFPPPAVAAAANKTAPYAVVATFLLAKQIFDNLFVTHGKQAVM